MEKMLLCPQINVKIVDANFNVKQKENNVTGPEIILLSTFTII